MRYYSTPVPLLINAKVKYTTMFGNYLASSRFFIYIGYYDFCNFSSDISATITTVNNRQIAVDPTQLMFNYNVSFTFTDCFDFALLDSISNSTLNFYESGTTNPPANVTML